MKTGTKIFFILAVIVAVIVAITFLFRKGSTDDSKEWERKIDSLYSVIEYKNIKIDSLTKVKNEKIQIIKYIKEDERKTDSIITNGTIDDDIEYLRNFLSEDSY